MRNLQVAATSTLVGLLVALSGAAWCQVESKVSLRLPDVAPDYQDQYLCMAARIGRDPRGYFATAFEPHANSSRVHHIIMFGCQSPGIMQPDAPQFVWDCSGMRSADQNDATPKSSFEQGPVCEGREQVLYGWALDAPTLRMPTGVGLPLAGRQSDIKYLVMQVHYHSRTHKDHNHNQNHKDHNNNQSYKDAKAQLKAQIAQHQPRLPVQAPQTDSSGVTVRLVLNDNQSRIDKRAGILLLESGGFVEPGKTRHEIWCEIEQDIEVHPFAFRVHTHKLGTRVMGAKLAPRGVGNPLMADDGDDATGIDRLDAIIGERNPQDPEMFYPVKNKQLVLTKGDLVYATCEYNNNQSRIVRIGPTGDDEMCNFYLMYWTEGPQTLDKTICYNVNPKELNYLQNSDQQQQYL